MSQGRSSSSRRSASARRFEDAFEQQQAAARVVVLGDGEQRAAQLGVAAKALGAADEPEVELVFEAEVGEQLGVVALGVVDEVAGVDLEELREQQARGVGEVRAGAGLSICER